jgi:hypothetical protein
MATACHVCLRRQRPLIAVRSSGIADRISRRWLTRTANPYASEIAAVGNSLDRPGAHFLNLSYEWGCTAAVAEDPAALGQRLIRALDWPLAGLGRHAVILRCQGAAGPYDNVT